MSFIKTVVAAAAALACSVATAAVITFDFTGSDVAPQTSRNFSSSGVNLTVTAGPSVSLGILGTLQAKVGQYAGLGLGVTGALLDENHAVDNLGADDYLLFTFTPGVTITGVSFSYFLPFVNATHDFSYQFNNNGWQSATFGGPLGISGDYDLSGLPNSTGVTQFWLGARSGQDNDAFKVASLTIHTAEVPEPATLALLGLSLAGLGFIRRRA